MANTSSRTLQLLSLLQTHRYWAGSDLAGRLEISARTLRRDVDRLRELGYPVKAHRGVDGGYQLAPGSALPPLVIDDEEAVALAIGLRAAAQGAVTGIEDSSLRAFAKVVQVMPARLRRRVDALRVVTVTAVAAGPTVEAGILTAVAQACRDEERLQFSYTAREGEHSTRHVEPHRLVALGQRWYLVAYDLTRHDWRSFRLDRLDEPRSTGERFRPRELPADDAAAFVRASSNSLPVPHTVEALVHAPAAEVRIRIGQWATVEEVADRRCKVRMTSETLDWPTQALGNVGAEFEVIGPPEFIVFLREWTARFTRATA